jgi:hypothetical protein
MPKSKVGVTLRIEVRDDKGRVVKVIETPSRSFTQNFATILVASQCTEYAFLYRCSSATFYDVMGNPIYVIGYTESPPSNGVYLFDVGAFFYSEFLNIASQYQSYTIYMPGIWPGTSPCPSPIYANGPCGPISTEVLVPSPFSFPSTSVLTVYGWQLTYSQTWTNVSSSPVIVSSVALVFGVTGDAASPVGFLLYAAIVDNISPAVLVLPNYSVTFTYTMLYAV